MGKSAEQALREKSGERTKKNGLSQINHAVSYVALVERVIELLLSAKPSDEILSELHHLFQTNPTQQRGGRRNERNKELRYAHKLRYHKYKKRVIA